MIKKIYVFFSLSLLLCGISHISYATDSLPNSFPDSLIDSLPDKDNAFPALPPLKQPDQQFKKPPIARGKSTNLPLPRFVSLKYSKTNMRSGPGKEYATLWVYQKKGLPIEIINEYEHWRRIRDLDGSEGWIHQSVLSGKRMVVTLEGTHDIYDKPNITSDVVAKVDGGIVTKPEKCQQNFCYIIHSDFSGWIEKNIIYGLYDHESFN